MNPDLAKVPRAYCDVCKCEIPLQAYHTYKGVCIACRRAKRLKEAQPWRNDWRR